MNRRDVLASLGTLGTTAVAGCLGVIGSNSSQTTNKAVQRRVSLAEQDTIADKYQLDMSVEVLEPVVSDEHPARIRVTTTNEGPKRAFSHYAGTDGCCLFNRDRGESDSPKGLWLHSSESKMADSNPAKDKWVADRPADESRLFPEYLCGSSVYPSGQSRHTEYVVWDDYRVEGYFSPGTYRWEEQISLWDDPDVANDESASATIPWGFSLKVKQPQ